MDVHKITICGGGNGAQTVVPVAACNLGCAVDLYSSLPGEAERLQAGVAAHGGLEVVGAVQARAQPRRISDSPAEVIPGSQVVLLVLPAFAHELILQQIIPFLDRDAWVGAMPARGGFEFCAARLLAEQGRDDVQTIRAVLEPGLNLRAVRPLQEWIVRSYSQDIGDPSSLHSAFVTNRAYAGLKAPVREVAPGRYVPDFAARYLAEDVPFGLAVSRAIAELAGVQTPAIGRVIAWAGARLGKDYLGIDTGEARTPQKYGWEKPDELLAFAAEA